jgi:hypothetical protein
MYTTNKKHKKIMTTKNQNSINLLKWLYNPTDFITFDEILKIAQIYCVPDEIIIMKYIQLMIKSNFTDEKILEIMSQYGVFIEQEIITKIREEHFHDNDQTDIDLTILNFFKMDNFCYKQEEKVKTSIKDANHIGYPLVDKYAGRAKISWKCCAYSNCCARFNNETDLIRHLIKCNAYLEKYHLIHEDLIAMNPKYTPQYFIENDLKICPAYCCKERFNTSQELVIHFTMLGIVPFWLNGMVPVYEELMLMYGIDTYACAKSTEKIDDKKINLNVKINKPLYRNDVCVCCYECVPDILFLPCKHSNICFKCCAKINNKICPECKTIVNRILPY